MTRSTILVCASAALLLALVCFVAPLPSVEARSSGLLTSCDLSPQFRWPCGKFGRNKTGAGNSGVTIGVDSGIMRWTDAPTPSSFYTIRSGDVGARSTDPTSYTPGVYSEIHLRVFDLTRRFIGIILYATNVTSPALGANKEVRVGSWDFPKGAPFQVPEETCGSSVVTHTSADLKPFHNRFFFMAPKGTGTVKFRVLLKQGEQNKGSFFYPDVDLFLTEGAPAVVQTGSTILPLVGNGVSNTVIGQAGRACADVCRLEMPALPYCHKAAIMAIKTVSSLQANVVGQAACRLPFLAGCEFAGVPTLDTLDGYCSFRSNNISTTCPASYSKLDLNSPTTYKPDVCYTAPTAFKQPICVCTNNIAYKGANPFKPVLSSSSTAGAAPVVTVKSSSTAAAAPVVVKSSSTAGAAPVVVVKSSSTGAAAPVVVKSSSTAAATPVVAKSSTAAATPVVVKSSSTGAAATVRKSSSTGSAAVKKPSSSTGAAAAADDSTGVDDAVVVEEPTGQTGLNSAASSVGPATSALVAMFAALVASSSFSSKSTRSVFIAVACVALVLALASPVAAHNYIKSQHRANEAAVSVPCQTRVGNQPHVQVVAGQTFEIEWSIGHGDYTHGPFYFVTVAIEDYDELRADNVTAMINDYVKLAPRTAYKNNSANADMWEKHHLRLTTEGAAKDAMGNVLEPRYDYYFKNDGVGIDSTDPTFIKREQAYMDKARPNQYKGNNFLNNRIIQTKFIDELVALDKRVSYASTKYPWIESVEIFDNSLAEHNVYSNQADIARFTIPARHGPGDYIVWFYWQGYKDCIDVNVMSGTTPVALRYGQNTTGQLPSVVKQDHCEYTYIGTAQTIARKLDPVTRDASACIADCRKPGSGCTGVQVVRVTNPAGTLAFPPNIPWIPQFRNETKISLGIWDACNQFSVNARIQGGCTLPTPYNLQPARFPVPLVDTDYICFGVNPLRNPDNQVEEDYLIATDPQDPVFYSTCWQMVPVGGFLNIEPWTYEPPSWSVADSCIDCAFQASLKKLNVSQAPDWTKAVTAPSEAGCIRCETALSTATVAAFQPTLSGPDQKVTA